MRTFVVIYPDECAVISATDEIDLLNQLFERNRAYMNFMPLSEEMINHLSAAFPLDSMIDVHNCCVEHQRLIFQVHEIKGTIYEKTK